MFDKDSTIYVHDFMITELGLSGTELLTYALIYQVASVRPFKMRCSLKYLANRVGITERNIKNIVNKLIDKNLIEREEYTDYGVSYTIYKVINGKKFPRIGQNITYNDVLTSKKRKEAKEKKEREYSLEDISKEDRTKFDSLESKDTDSNTITLDDKLQCYDNQCKDSNTSKIDDIEDANNDTPKNKTKYFIAPTAEEVNEYCNSRKNGISGQEFVDFYASKGWMIGKNKMKDWKAAVRTWENKRKKENGDAGDDDVPHDLDYIFGD